MSDFSDNLDAKVYVAGHTGLVGSALVRALRAKGYRNLLTASSDELDLRNQQETEVFFLREKPEYVFLAAARVGGIRANMTYPAEFIFDNTMIQSNVIHNSWLAGVKKLQFFGSCCAYPTEAAQPLKEEDWLTGKPESTNHGFAVAKFAGVAMCQAYHRQYGARFISAIPANLYGPGDCFAPAESHIVGQAMRLMHEAKLKGIEEVVLGGTGEPLRDLLYVDDLAEAALLLMDRYESPEIINIGTGAPLSKRAIAEAVQRAVGYEGRLVFDPQHPDGMMRRSLDVSKISSLGWRAKTSVEEGMQKTYQWFLEHH